MSKQKAVIYARNTDKRHIDSQVQHLLSYCDCENLEVVGIVRDKRKGKNIRRWKLRKAEHLAKRKQADFIVMTDVSRISRSMLNAINIGIILKRLVLAFVFRITRLLKKSLNSSLMFIRFSYKLLQVHFC